MIYRNDNIKEENDRVIGSVKDLLEYFRYELASQCMTGDEEKENFIDNAENIINFIKRLHCYLEHNDYNKKEIIAVAEHPMGGLYIDFDYLN